MNSSHSLVDFSFLLKRVFAVNDLFGLFVYEPKNEYEDYQ
jgi:hypothetical protein